MACFRPPLWSLASSTGPGTREVSNEHMTQHSRSFASLRIQQQIYPMTREGLKCVPKGVLSQLSWRRLPLGLKSCHSRYCFSWWFMRTESSSEQYVHLVMCRGKGERYFPLIRNGASPNCSLPRYSFNWYSQEPGVVPGFMLSSVWEGGRVRGQRRRIRVKYKTQSLPSSRHNQSNVDAAQSVSCLPHVGSLERD